MYEFIRELDEGEERHQVWQRGAAQGSGVTAVLFSFPQGFNETARIWKVVNVCITINATILS
jgi:hypothetical protein